MTRWLAICAVAIMASGCGGRVQEPEPYDETADAGGQDTGTEPPGPSQTVLPNGCVSCVDDKLCNYCLVQASGTTWRCPVGAEPPSASCWGLDEVHAAAGLFFTCYYGC
jgi:hypothetical protein